MVERGGKEGYRYSVFFQDGDGGDGREEKETEMEGEGRRRNPTAPLFSHPLPSFVRRCVRLRWSSSLLSFVDAQ